MNIIIEYFNQILPIAEREIEEVTPLLRTRTLLKDEFLLSENQPCNFLTFIKTGSFRSFHVKSNGNSSILMLNSNNEFISNYESFISGLPSNIYIQAIEKSEVITISKIALNRLLEDSLYWNKLGRILTENIFVIAKLRLESIIYKTPEERYRDLITNSPSFLEKYALTDIASFIGVTPQSLSRIRARMC